MEANKQLVNDEYLYLDAFYPHKVYTGAENKGHLCIVQNGVTSVLHNATLSWELRFFRATDSDISLKSDSRALARFLITKAS